MYKSYLHGIKEITCDTLTQSIGNIAETKYNIGDTINRNTRISLTIRHVNKTINSSKLHALFGKQKR